MLLSGDRDVLSWGCERCGRAELDPSKDQDEVKRKRRGCDTPNRSIDFEWAPFLLHRCPWAHLTDETPEVFDWIVWWEDWETFRSLPFGSSSISHEPNIAYEVLRECARTRTAVEAERAEKHEAEFESLKRKGRRR